MVEAEPSIYSVWYGGFAHGFLEGAALGVGAVEYGYLIVGYEFVVVKLVYATYYGVGFVDVAVCLHEGDGFADAAL